MKYLLLLLIALASCHTVKKDPLPVVKCLLESDKLANDIVAVIDAVKKFVEDKDLNALLSVCLTAVPDAYNEVMKCVNQDVNLQKFKDPPKIKLPKNVIKQLKGQFKKMIKKLPKKLLNGILNALKDYGIEEAKKFCNEQIEGDEAICDNLVEILKDEIKFQIK